MLSQYKNPVLVDIVSPTSMANAETAINNALSANPGYSLAGLAVVSNPGQMYYVLDEDWGVPNPIHSVVLVTLTAAMSSQLATALSANPGYRFVDSQFFPGVPDYAIVLGQS